MSHHSLPDVYDLYETALIDRRRLPPGVRWAWLTSPAGAAGDRDWSYRYHRGAEWPAIGDHPPRMTPWRGDAPAAPLPVDGIAWLEKPACKPLLRRPGEAWRDTLAWDPVLPALAGRRILIDPTGGGVVTDGRGPLGVTGGELNLRVAERLAALLRGCGATAVLTREDVRHVPAEEKVLLANRTDADLFLTIGRNPGARTWRLLHHYGSLGGAYWAARLAEAAAELAAPDTIPIAESYAYLLRHTPCTALSCLLPAPVDAEAERRLAAAAHQQAVALALLESIAAYFTPESERRPALDPAALIASEPAQFPADLDLIRVDGNLLWLPPEDGIAAARVPLSAGPHYLEIRAGDDWWLKRLIPGDGPPRIETLLAGIGGRVGVPEDFAPPSREIADDLE